VGVYVSDWTRRAYVQDELSPFPEDFAALCRRITGLISGNTGANLNADSVASSGAGSDPSLQLEPEAGIINYYPLGSTMGGHLDDAEHCLERPIVSFSLGLSGLFLLGGCSRQQEPRVLFLRSGDAVIMAGDSRMCYHGVPSIIPLEEEQLLVPAVPPTVPSLADCCASAAESESVDNTIESDARFVVEYLRTSRVNMNARQVRKLDGSVWVDKTGTGYVNV